MQLNKLDIKIQEAANLNEPVFEEESWNKMEKLLDVHLPQKKKDKRKFIWLFLLLFFVTGTLLMITKPLVIKEKAFRSPEENIAGTLANEYEVAVKTSANSTEIINERKFSKNNSITKNTDRIHPLNSSVNKPFNQRSFFDSSARQNKRLRRVIGSSITDVKMVQPGNENVIANNNPDNSKLEFEQQINSQDNTKTIKKDEGEENKNNPTKENAITNSSVEPKNNHTPGTKINPPKNKNNFSNSFVINLSAGPDVSTVDIGDIGKINPIFGAGVGYNIGKSLTIRTGFYVTRKVYEAISSQYHPPAGFWNMYPDLDYIDANCKVYEIPLIVNYNFSQTSKHLWFGGAGLSSYFMKKEVYNYFPKNLSTIYPYSSYALSNKNNHFLASLRLSAGYERKFNNHISVIAEPYLNLPLEGIGFGKVKLYSTGILFTLSVKPFVKK